MTLVQLDFFAAGNPNGAILHTMTSDDDYFESLALKIRLRELGGGTLVVSRQIGFGVIDSGIFSPEVFVRVLVPSIHPTRYIWGFWLDLREQQLVSVDEGGGEKYAVGGPGPLFYWHRAILWDHKLSDAGTQWKFDKDNAIINIPNSATIGNVIMFMKQEDEQRGTSFLPDAEYGFNHISDSNSGDWGPNWEVGEDYTLDMGNNYLDELWKLQEQVESLDYTVWLGSTSEPHLRLDAWKGLGQDLTTTDFDGGNVLFKEGVNIESDLSTAQGFGTRSTKGQASGTSLRKATHALVRGDEGVWDQATATSFVDTSTSYRKAVKVDYPKSKNEAVLERAGLRWLRRQENGNNEFELDIKPGFQATQGLYMPGPGEQLWSASPSNGHFWIGDTVTLKTGDLPGNPSSWLDFAYEPEWVTGIDMILREAAEDGTDEKAARSWDVRVIFNTERGSDNSPVARSGAGGGAPGYHTHGPNPKLCPILDLGTETIVRWYFDDTTADAIPTAHAAWDNDATESGNSLKATADGNYSGTGSGFTNSQGGDADGRNVMMWRGMSQTNIGSAMATAFAAGGMIVRAQMKARARSGVGISESSQHIISNIMVALTQGATTTLRGVAKAPHALTTYLGATIWPAQTTHINRVFPAATDTNVLDPVAGAASTDRIWVELGNRNYTTVTSGSAIQLENDGASDMPEDETTTDTDLNTWIEFRFTAAPTGSGKHPDLVGTSTRAARCDHSHHILANRAPTTADDITQGLPTKTMWTDTVSGITYLLIDAATGEWIILSHGAEQDLSGFPQLHVDTVAPGVNEDADDGFDLGDFWLNTTTGNVYIANDVTVGAAVWSLLGNTDHGVLSGLTDDDHPQYAKAFGGGEDDVQSHGAMGAAETIDPAQGNWHYGTLDNDCTLTFTAPTAGKGATLLLEFIQDSTGGWAIDLPASFVNKTELEAAQDTTADGTSFLLAWTRDGGTNWVGAWHGTPAASTPPSSSGGEILISDTPSTPLIFADLIQNEAQDDLVYTD